tara:strand:- start:87677 stop:88762 length:1086 start_codon:yes stop_codon:yes gene_type:complete
MKILLVGYLYGRGGIQNHTHWLATGLSERGHDVSVLTPEPLRGRSTDLECDVKYSRMTYRNNGRRNTIHSLMRFVRCGAFDVSIVCGTGWMAMLAVILNRRIRKRVFFEVMSGDRNGRIDPRSIAHCGFDAVVGQAPTVEQRFCEEFNWKGTRTSIPALPDPLERMSELKTPQPDYSSGIQAAYFGRLAHHKGVGFLIEHWNRISNSVVSLDIYGTGPEEANLAAAVERLGLQDQIRFHGEYPSGIEYVELIQRHHLVLLPTTGKEGAPLVLLESMACGVPFIANGVGGIPNYSNSDAGITSGDIDEFIPLVESFCQQMIRGEVSPARLQRHYTRHFSFSALSEKWESFCDSLVRQPNSPQ